MAVDFLSSEQAAGFGRFPDEVSREDLERSRWLDDADLSVAGCRRGMHNRLGFAVQLATVRVVGRFRWLSLGQWWNFWPGSWALRMLPLSSFTRSGARPVTRMLRRFLSFTGTSTSLIRSRTRS
jgi:hypothetical protein